MAEDARDFFVTGERFHGYVVQKRLGRGGGGAVYLVHHEMLDTLYALKVLDPAVAGNDPVYVKRFLREARLASRIRHPNLVAVHDCGHDEERNLHYLVMDYVPGGSLRDTLAFEGRVSFERAAEIVAQVASALDAAQPFQVVHRDIKPENIMIQPDGRVKLVDLGIAKAQNLGDSLHTNTDSTFGTPSYVSPEQAQCSADVDARADIYSLGIVFYEMLTGACPFVGKNAAQVLAQILSDEPVPDVRDVIQGVPAGLAVLVRRMTAKDRAARLPSFRAVLDEIAKLGLAKEVSASAPPEYAAKPLAGMRTLLNGLRPSASSGEAADPLARPDEDVRAFLANRDRRQTQRLRRRRGLFAGAVVLLVVLLVLLILL